MGPEIPHFGGFPDTPKSGYLGPKWGHSDPRNRWYSVPSSRWHVLNPRYLEPPLAGDEHPMCECAHGMSWIPAQKGSKWGPFWTPNGSKWGPFGHPRAESGPARGPYLRKLYGHSHKMAISSNSGVSRSPPIEGSAGIRTLPRGHSIRIPGIPDEVRDRELRDFDLIDLSMRGSGLQYDPPIWTTRWSDLGHWTPLARDLRRSLWAAFGYLLLKPFGLGVLAFGQLVACSVVGQFVAPSGHSR